MLPNGSLQRAACLAELLLCLVNNQIMSGDFIDSFCCCCRRCCCCSCRAAPLCLTMLLAGSRQDRAPPHTEISARQEAPDLLNAHTEQRTCIICGYKHYLASYQIEQLGDVYIYLCRLLQMRSFCSNRARTHTSALMDGQIQVSQHTGPCSGIIN